MVRLLEASPIVSSTVTQRSGVNRKVDRISGGVSKGLVLRDQRLYGA